MSREITIDPITRIEGHARITLTVDDGGKVEDARFHVTQFRGFEKFVEGRPMTEMPAITARICGICPVSHLMASAKACDDLLAVEIPPTAEKLRRMMHLAQLVQSHALHFFHLASPDLLLGWDADPAIRNVFGLIKEHPDKATDGVVLRKWGQEIIGILGGKKIHPAWTVAGGVNQPLAREDRDYILTSLPNAMEITKRTMDFFKSIMDRFHEETEHFGNFDSLFLSLVTPEGNLEQYDGPIRVKDKDGNIVADGIKPREYHDYINEAVEEYSYLKFPYYAPMGYPDGFYRVGPLARVNNADGCDTPLADAELKEFKQRVGGIGLSSFHFHYARLVEIFHGIETIERLLHAPDILDTFVRARARPNRPEGVGIAEAPRGTLIHHYRIDEDGRMIWANLIVATGHNNLAMNRGIKQVAQHWVDGNNLQEGMLNRVEALIRCYDPCLSCSTHALGQMPLHIELVDPQGNVLDEVKRE